jgi:hypothetical protein
LADRFVKAPYVADPDYAEWLEGMLAETGAALYVPLIDADIAIASRLGREGRTGSTRIGAPPAASAAVCWDKLATHEWLRERGLPSPGTWLPPEAPDDAGELIAKSRFGQGSRGFRVLSSSAPPAPGTLDEEAVVQERCEPPEVTIDTFLASDGTDFRAVCRERLETKAGICTKARVFEDEGLAALAEQVARGLGLSGGSCTQVMRRGDGWVVTDVNARPGAGTPLSTAAGVDVLGAVYADLLGCPFDRDEGLARLSRDVYVVRHFDELVVD